MNSGNVVAWLHADTTSCSSCFQAWRCPLLIIESEVQEAASQPWHQTSYKDLCWTCWIHYHHQQIKIWSNYRVVTMYWPIGQYCLSSSTMWLTWPSCYYDNTVFLVSCFRLHQELQQQSLPNPRGMIRHIIAVPAWWLWQIIPWLFGESGGNPEATIYTVKNWILWWLRVHVYSLSLLKVHYLR